MKNVVQPLTLPALSSGVAISFTLRQITTSNTSIGVVVNGPSNSEGFAE
jgi:hypothetical protein